MATSTGRRERTALQPLLEVRALHLQHFFLGQDVLALLRRFLQTVPESIHPLGNGGNVPRREGIFLRERLDHLL